MESGNKENSGTSETDLVTVHALVPSNSLQCRYFGGLLKICHLAEFTLAVEPVLAILIYIHSKMANRTRWELNWAVS